MPTDLRTRVLRAAKNPAPIAALQRLAAKTNGHEALRILASLQGGQFATAQAHALGLTPAAIKWLAASGETHGVRRGVWRFVSADAPDAAVSAWLACWPGAWISHVSAAKRHGLKIAGPADPTTHLTVERARSLRIDGIAIHRSRSMDSTDRVWIDGVAYTTVARTVCDLADSDAPWPTLSRLDDAVAAGAAPGWIHARATALLPGRPECRLICAATAPGAAAVFRSLLERIASHVYRAGHLPDPEWNVRVHDDDGLIGIVDALWRPWSVISEKEGLRFHTTPRQRRKDAERFNRLLDSTYDPRRFTWHDVVERPLYVVATLARPLIAAGAPVDLARIPQHIEIPDWSEFGRPWRP
jgi:hypothetical protein